jgi:hypothetical protein
MGCQSPPSTSIPIWDRSSEGNRCSVDDEFDCVDRIPYSTIHKVVIFQDRVQEHSEEEAQKRVDCTRHPFRGLSLYRSQYGF